MRSITSQNSTTSGTSSFTASVSRKRKGSELSETTPESERIFGCLGQVGHPTTKLGKNRTDPNRAQLIDAYLANEKTASMSHTPSESAVDLESNAHDDDDITVDQSMLDDACQRIIQHCETSSCTEKCINCGSVIEGIADTLALYVFPKKYDTVTEAHLLCKHLQALTKHLKKANVFAEECYKHRPCIKKWDRLRRLLTNKEDGCTNIQIIVKRILALYRSARIEEQMELQAQVRAGQEIRGVTLCVFREKVYNNYRDMFKSGYYTGSITNYFACSNIVRNKLKSQGLKSSSGNPLKVDKEVSFIGGKLHKRGLLPITALSIWVWQGDQISREQDIENNVFDNAIFKVCKNKFITETAPCPSLETVELFVSEQIVKKIYERFPAEKSRWVRNKEGNCTKGYQAALGRKEDRINRILLKMARELLERGCLVDETNPTCAEWRNLSLHEQKATTDGEINK